MARLLDWPTGLRLTSYQRLTGPRSVGAASTESIEGFVQTVSSPFGVWRYQLSLESMRRAKHRLYRRMVTALHGGANAVRVPFCDPDGLSFAEAGVDISPSEIINGVPFENGLPFSNGANWSVSRPPVAVAEDAAVGDTEIVLENQHWGHTIEAGWIGFFPLHFGKYEITEVIEPGRYRIWPPLRAALDAVVDDVGSYSTLYPVLAMRLEGESAGTVQRGVGLSEGNSLTLIEVEDSDARAYFADA